MRERSSKLKSKKSSNQPRFVGDSDDDDESDHDDEFAEAEGLNDEFFSLKEMNEFADDAEDAEWRAIEKEERGDASGDDEENEESDFDYFQDPDEMESDEEGDEEEEDIEASDDDEMEEDDEDESEEETGDNNKMSSTRNLFADDDDEDGQDGKSAFEKQQERLKEKIQELEDESIAKKSGPCWASKDRPLNSLLEEDLEFEHAGKAVPVITEEITATIEDMIKQRIIDNRFDDVIRKKDPKATPFRPSQQFEFNDEKSKQSLAQIYEDEYVKATSDEPVTDVKDEALQKEHTEIDGMWRYVCSQLDALSNQHFVPKQPKTEIKVVADVAAISMEEATPVTANDASLLAPEEIYEKKRGEVKGVTELDQAERKRLRNRKKRLHKLRHGDKKEDDTSSIAKHDKSKTSKFEKTTTKH
ncbi:U3 small nucleolar ribonucleoprotein complex, subunit Mpp10 [Syncephalis fuscata]|nr:U3 small nucleolar ribonucleoprotein complex, subunit Mpp10 [Syncephalis fuscata]